LFVDLIKRHGNLSTDIAAHQFLFKSSTSRALLEQLVEHVGAERVLYATDWPWGDSSPEAMVNNVAFVRDATFLDEAQKASILGLNACRSLGI
jgi:predicted TIM-barrel fold metal-dependent hydrolase